MKTNDGGPAFPRPHSKDEHRGEQGCWAQDGMTLRDYFAAHCDQPGQAEIVTAAGLVMSAGKVWVDDKTTCGTFNEWYSGLSCENRFALYAQVRYEMADAMLREREK